MSQRFVRATNPAVPLWRRRSFAALALCALLVAIAGVIVVRAISNNSSIEGRPPTRPATAPIALVSVPVPSPVQFANVCTAPSNLDGAHILAVLASMPNGTAAQLTATLSPQTQQKIEEAALTAALITGSVPATPDGLDLRGVLARSNPADQQLLLTALSSNVRASLAIEFDPSWLPMEFQAAFAGITGAPLPTCP